MLTYNTFRSSRSHQCAVVNTYELARVQSSELPYHLNKLENLVLKIMPWPCKIQNWRKDLYTNLMLI